MKRLIVILMLAIASINFSSAQEIDGDQLGAWYMYFYNAKFSASTRWGIQGDFQYRDFQILGDREQLLLRSGLTYTPKNPNILLTLGYANISTGTFGTDSDQIGLENRMYQEALISTKVFNKLLLTHRYRFEQRWVEKQDFRIRYRYMLFVNIPFKGNELSPGVVYAALYNELFINNERKIGDNNFVELFDRNRTYLGLGYVLNENI